MATSALPFRGVLILRRILHLWRAIWVIILEQRQYSSTYTHAFFMQRVPLYTFFPYFCYYFYLFGPQPLTNGALVACPQYGMGCYELCVVPALGTPKTARVR